MATIISTAETFWATETPSKTFISEFQIRIQDNDGPTLADIRRASPKLASTYYSKVHPAEYTGPCLCKTCRTPTLPTHGR